MALILDIPTQPTIDNGGFPVPEIIAPPVYRMPASSRYLGVAIGPSSDHDVVRVQFPGVDSLLWRGTVLPMPPVAQGQKVSIRISKVRAMGGRLQVMGLTEPEEFSAVARLRAPNTGELIIQPVGDVVPVPIDVVIPYAGRSTVNLTASIGGEVGDPAPPISVATSGRIYRFNQTAAIIEDNTNFVAYGLNEPPWPIAGDLRTFSWNESEPEFDEIVYSFTNTSGPEGDETILWVKWEARD